MEWLLIWTLANGDTAQTQVAGKAQCRTVAIELYAGRGIFGEATCISPDGKRFILDCREPASKLTVDDMNKNPFVCFASEVSK